MALLGIQYELEHPIVFMQLHSGKAFLLLLGLKEPSLHLQMGSHGLKEIPGQQRLFIKLHMVEINF